MSNPLPAVRFRSDRGPNGVSDGAAELPGGPSPEATPPAPSYRRTLSSRPFLLLWSSLLISQSGDFVFDVALVWLVFATTGSVVAVSYVLVAATVPAVVFGPILGVYVDRWPRRTILIVTNLLEGALVAGLATAVLAHSATLPLILVVVFALGVGQQFVRVTSNALIPQTVEKHDLSSANGLLTLSGNSIQIVGLAIGGVVVALFGATLPIVWDAASFVLAAAILGAMSALVGRPVPEDGPVAVGFGAQFAEGFRYVASQRFLLEVIAIGVVVNFAGNAAFTQWAPYASRVLHGGAATFGLLGAMIAGGAIAGALLVGKVNLRPIAGPVIFLGLFAVGGFVLSLGFTRSIPLALAEAFGVGVASSVINVPLLTVVQGKVPARLMGRAMSVLLALILVAAPFGEYLSGVIASATSIPFLYVVMGLLTIVVAGAGALGMRDVRTLTY